MKKNLLLLLSSIVAFLPDLLSFTQAWTLVGLVVGIPALIVLVVFKGFGLFENSEKKEELIATFSLVVLVSIGTFGYRLASGVSFTAALAPQQALRVATVLGTEKNTEAMLNNIGKKLVIIQETQEVMLDLLNQSIEEEQKAKNEFENHLNLAWHIGDGYWDAPYSNGIILGNLEGYGGWARDTNVRDYLSGLQDSEVDLVARSSISISPTIPRDIDYEFLVKTVHGGEIVFHQFGKGFRKKYWDTGGGGLEFQISAGANQFNAGGWSICLLVVDLNSEESWSIIGHEVFEKEYDEVKLNPNSATINSIPTFARSRTIQLHEMTEEEACTN